MTANKQKILVVDDDSINIKTVCTILASNKKYELYTALSGESAIEIASKESLDLILLDIQMGGIDGYKTCSVIKNIANYENVPIFFLTADNSNESIKKGFDAGAVDYLNKPVRPEELLARVNTHLSLKEQTSMLKNLNSELDKKVNERTAELFEANKQLKKIDKIKHDFLSLISHEIRTPLNAISGFTGLIEFTELNDDQKNYLRYLKNGVKRLSSLSELALLATSMKTDNQCIKDEIVDLSEILSQTLNLMSDHLLQKKITVDVSGFDEGSIIKADPGMILKILQVTLENSIYHCNEQSIINIFAEKKDSYQYINILNAGNNIPQKIIDNLNHFFKTGDMFEQKDGVGITFTTVKFMADMNKGGIQIENYDKGVKVALYFNLAS